MTDRDPPLLWCISRRPETGEVYLSGLDRYAQPVWCQFWHAGALRFATAAEALDVLRLYAPTPSCNPSTSCSTPGRVTRAKGRAAACTRSSGCA